MIPASHIGREIGALAPSAQLRQIETILSFVDPSVREAVQNRQGAGSHPKVTPALPGAVQKRLTGVAPGTYSKEAPNV